MRLAWVTTAAARGTDLDEPVALAALAARSVAVEVVDWDDPAVDWAAYDRVLLRSPWDYHDRRGEFLRWVEAVAAVADLRNGPDMVRWSTNKHYLAELAAAGVAVVPTAYAEPGQPATIPPGGVVVKPAVGAGSRDVAVCPDGRGAAEQVARLHAAGQTALVQPLLRSVAAEGEWALVFFGGRYSHAASKRVTLPSGAVTDALYAPETTAAHAASPEQVAVASAALAWVTDRFGTPTYARIDLVKGDDGEPLVLEVELVEPSLFLPEGGAAAGSALVDALLTG